MGVIVLVIGLLLVIAIVGKCLEQNAQHAKELCEKQEVEQAQLRKRYSEYKRQARIPYDAWTIDIVKDCI